MHALNFSRIYRLFPMNFLFVKLSQNYEVCQ